MRNQMCVCAHLMEGFTAHLPHLCTEGCGSGLPWNIHEGITRKQFMYRSLWKCALLDSESAMYSTILRHHICNGTYTRALPRNNVQKCSHAHAPSGIHRHHSCTEVYVDEGILLQNAKVEHVDAGKRSQMMPPFAPITRV
ncbi:hypothetical protein GOP47_0003355 [Adiantum capillus-veneris]|uniref:Uncharacterized protein n=1 Tax=Adiantum capillus-veneris TaxID=13818 RepID=A0A9D4VCB5_ADICA|nr:hypothetical protein GOP47_0003355 [Adiantum capillus-veneris]